METFENLNAIRLEIAYDDSDFFENVIAKPFQNSNDALQTKKRKFIDFLPKRQRCVKFKLRVSGEVSGKTTFSNIGFQLGEGESVQRLATKNIIGA